MNIKRTDDSRYKTGNQNQKHYFSVFHDLTLRVRTIKTFYSLVVLAASRPALLATLAGVWTQYAVGCGRPCRFAARTPRNPHSICPLMSFYINGIKSWFLLSNLALLSVLFLFIRFFASILQA